jgi:hypothetical protein
MKRLAVGMVMFVFVAALSEPAPAQMLLSKKSKVNPTQRVPELILTLKTEPDERKRVQAATALRDFDITTFNEIVPILAEVLVTDKSANVRMEAITSLSRIRPVTQIAGHAIEKAAAEDESVRVRLHARAALPKYHLAGYTSRKAEPAKKKQTDEPPIGGTPTPMPSPKVTNGLPKFQPLPLGDGTPRPLPPGVTPKTPVEGPALFPK